jgi:hypothetical protein
MQVRMKATFKVKSPRRLPDPIQGIDRHIWLVSATDLPVGIPKDANPREQKIDRSIYKKVAQSLLNEDCNPNTFHLKNKGITLLATSVEKVGTEDNHEVFEVHFVGDKQGIVDGGHTYDVITTHQEVIKEQNLNCEADQLISQFVKVEVLTGPEIDTYGVEIAGGLNTAVQVQEFSLQNLDGKFDWIKTSLAEKGYESAIAFKQNQQRPYDVKEILAIMDLFNIEDFPVSSTSTKHPQRTCTGEAQVLKRFVDAPEIYHRFSEVLPQLLEFHDLVIRGTLAAYNRTGGRGSVNWIKGVKSRDFYFPPLTVKPANVPFKGAAFPMLAAFRCFLELNERTQKYQWTVSFPRLVQHWEQIGPTLTEYTHETYLQVGRNVDAIAKSRAHWGNLLNTVRMNAQEQDQ